MKTLSPHIQYICLDMLGNIELISYFYYAPHQRCRTHTHEIKSLPKLQLLKNDLIILIRAILGFFKVSRYIPCWMLAVFCNKLGNKIELLVIVGSNKL